MKPLLTVLAAAYCLSASAQQPNNPESGIRGTFMAFIDDHATLFLDGNRVFSGGLGTARSREIELREGSSLVVHLRNDGGPRAFMLVFESSDGKTIASFRSGDFKIVPAAGVTSFTPSQFAQWRKSAKSVPGRKDKALDKVTKNYSDTVWGDLDTCTLACRITRNLFTQRPRG